MCCDLAGSVGSRQHDCEIQPRYAFLLFFYHTTTLECTSPYVEFNQIENRLKMSHVPTLTDSPRSHHICDLLWRNREQVARQMFLLSAVQYIAWPIGPTLSIQPHNVNNTGNNSTLSFIKCIHAGIIKVSLCYGKGVQYTASRYECPEWLCWIKIACTVDSYLKWATCQPPTCSLFRQRGHIMSILSLTFVTYAQITLIRQLCWFLSCAKDLPNLCLPDIKSRKPNWVSTLDKFVCIHSAI